MIRSINSAVAVVISPTEAYRSVASRKCLVKASLRIWVLLSFWCRPALLAVEDLLTIRMISEEKGRSPDRLFFVQSLNPIDLLPEQVGRLDQTETGTEALDG